MRKKIQSIYYFTENLFSSIVSLFSILFFSSFKSACLMKKLARKNIIKEIDILGNGPSLNSILVEKPQYFENKNLMVVNFFCFSDVFFTVKPHYYVFIEPDFLLKKTHERFNDKLPLFIDSMMKVNWDLFFFYPQHNKKSYVISKLKGNKHIKIIPFNTTPLYGFENLNRFFYSKNLGMPVSQNISIAAIFIALQLNIKIINLYGVEHSWITDLYVNDFNQVCLDDKHCYKESKTLTIYNSTLWELLNAYSKVFKSHKRLRVYSDKIGAIIINNSKGSYIDAYERNL